ncbi:MAG: hypothetical protein MUC56_17340 [Thermoanaerobaculales bacterium]|jgi:hypothetical protein|nr:hypothetical protein [Thermoanaerobaculales bacterium]
MSGASPVTVDGPLARFVRETLGCGCPDEVVAATVLDAGPQGELGLDVGGRLLVRVLPAEDLDRLVDGFPETVERLLAERDRRGFNRLRLVVAHPQPELVGETLRAMLAAIHAADDRVFVHGVPPEAVPAALAAMSP